MREYSEKIKKVKNQLTARKCKRTKNESEHNLVKSMCCINTLNTYMEERSGITDVTIQQMIDHLVGHNTLVFDSLLPCEIKIKRGRIINTESVKSVQQLSYNKNSEKICQGRLNPSNRSFFYGVIHFEATAGTNIVFSEIDTKEENYICILNSATNKELTYRQLGIFEKIRKDDRPWYFNDSIWNYYKKVYELYQHLSHRTDFEAFLLTENFLYNVISKKESRRVYDVTNAIYDILLGDQGVEGVIYDSIFDGTTPNIMLKPDTVDEKLVFLDTEAFKINKIYSCNLYDASLTFKGKILSTGEIEWSPIEHIC